MVGLCFTRSAVVALTGKEKAERTKKNKAKVKRARVCKRKRKEVKKRESGQQEGERRK